MQQSFRILSAPVAALQSPPPLPQPYLAHSRSTQLSAFPRRKRQRNATLCLPDVSAFSASWVSPSELPWAEYSSRRPERSPAWLKQSSANLNWGQGGGGWVGWAVGDERGEGRWVRKGEETSQIGRWHAGGLGLNCWSAGACDCIEGPGLTCRRQIFRYLDI